MDYEKKSFSVPVGSKKYRDNWDKIFGDGEEDLNEENQEETKPQGKLQGWSITETYSIGKRVINSEKLLSKLDSLSEQELKDMLGKCGFSGCSFVSLKVNDAPCGKCRAIYKMLGKLNGHK